MCLRDVWGCLVGTRNTGELSRVGEGVGASRGVEVGPEVFERG